MQGALVTAAGLLEVPADAPLLGAVPPLFLAWMPAGAPEPYPPERSVGLPLYLDIEREHTLARAAPAGARRGGQGRGRVARPPL